MPKILINESEHKIEVPILLTAVSGKICIKNRSIVNKYRTHHSQSHITRVHLNKDKLFLELKKSATMFFSRE